MLGWNEHNGCKTRVLCLISRHQLVASETRVRESWKANAYSSWISGGEEEGETEHACCCFASQFSTHPQPALGQEGFW